MGNAVDSVFLVRNPILDKTQDYGVPEDLLPAFPSLKLLLTMV